MNDVMIDFEAFGTNKGASICQVGAVFFDKVTGELGSEFKANIDAGSFMKYGGTMDASAVYWWLAQSEQARASILAEPRKDAMTAMTELNEFLRPAKRVWSHATFDFVLLMDTLKTLGIKPSISYKTGMDLRTLTYLAGTGVRADERTGVHHDGLDDAKFQVKYAVAALNKIKTNKKIIAFVEEATRIINE